MGEQAREGNRERETEGRENTKQKANRAHSKPSSLRIYMISKESHKLYAALITLAQQYIFTATKYMEHRFNGAFAITKVLAFLLFSC